MAFKAGARAEEMMGLAGLSRRLSKITRRLQKFDFASTACGLASLLTSVEYHPAAARLEALIHLSAIYCRGGRRPTAAQLREWLNDIILPDPLASMEDPVEDVFVSNVSTWFGNARLFDGGWGDNDYYVQTCLAALKLLADHGWAKRAQTNVIALLRIGEALAARTDVARFTLSTAAPCRPIRSPTHKLATRFVWLRA